MKKEKLFGTDGIRGIAGILPITNEVMYAAGKAIVDVLNTKNKTILIGKDTRESGDVILTYLKKGIESKNGSVISLGVSTTPAIAYITKTLKAPAGIVISASHNPYNHNGIKIFDTHGNKLNEEIENQIEEKIWKYLKKEPLNINLKKSNQTTQEKENTKIEQKINQKVNDEEKSTKANNNLNELYINHAQKTIKHKSKSSIVLDCANGAAYEIAPQILLKCGFQTHLYANTPNGININEACGSLHPEKIQDLVKKHNAICGIALDGDADRITMCDEEGEILDGDTITALLAAMYHEENKLSQNTVVLTIMSNQGIINWLEKKGIICIKTKVGDKYLIEEMKKNKYVLGGEQSGHIIINPYSTTGDGIIAGLQIIEYMTKTKKKLSELRKSIPLFPQTLINVNVKEKIPLEKLESYYHIKKYEEEVKKSGRVLVRYSGTEQKCRIMVEHQDKNKANEYASKIMELLQSEIGEI
ncbi:MAG: phosphoglucosamine mutase [Candidatus Woesearchaeota archaeon]